MGPAAGNGASHAASLASLARRLLALAYDLLLLAAVLLVGALPFVALAEQADAALKRPLFQLYLTALVGGYFLWQWCHGGQTLPMKTWRVKLVTFDGAPIKPRRALARFAFAVAGLALAGAGFAWALVDRDGLFLHDRLAGTKIVKDEG